MVDGAERLQRCLAKREVGLGQVGRLDGRIVRLPVWEFPKTGIHSAAWPALHEHLPAPNDDEADEPPLGRRHPLGQGRDGFDFVFLAGEATAFQRAVAAKRVARRADQRAQFHHRLVEGGGVSLPWLLQGQRVFHQVGGNRPQAIGDWLGLRRLFDTEQSRQHSGDVAVHDRLGLVERDAADRAAGVTPHSRQRQHASQVAGEAPAKLVADLLGRLLQVARPRVVAEAFPKFDHRVVVGSGERFDVRELLHPPLPIRDHRLDLRLLQHDLRHPDCVRIARPPPRQIAGVPGEPLEQRRSDGADVHRRGSVPPGARLAKRRPLTWARLRDKVTAAR